MEVMFLKNEKVTHTPKGLADILWEECDLKYHIETVARNVFAEHGYKMVQTPTFEYYDVYNAATPNKAESMFKFFDVNGRMLCGRILPRRLRGLPPQNPLVRKHRSDCAIPAAPFGMMRRSAKPDSGNFPRLELS